MTQKSSILRTIKCWFDNTAMGDRGQRINWMRIIPFIGLHLVCFAVFWVGWSPFALVFALLMYLIRMFAITGFYHRYFAHKAFKTSRGLQFLFALIGAASTQRGPLWWAAHHRNHHRFADTEKDAHAPRHGFIWSHMAWFLSDQHFATPEKSIPDLIKFPELRWLDRFDLCVPVGFATAIFLLGAWLETAMPSLGTNAWQLLVWGYFISTVVLLHVTLMVNSVAHRWGSRRYNTGDESRNNFLLALLTLGEGWHNNHHHYAGSARQGFYWWEIDMTYYLLKVMSLLGLIRELKPLPLKIRDQWQGSQTRGKQ